MALSINYADPSMAAQAQGQQVGQDWQGPDQMLGGLNLVKALSSPQTAAVIKQLGYTGPLTEGGVGGGDAGASPTTISPQFEQWMNQKGYSINVGAFKGQDAPVNIVDKGGQTLASGGLHSDAAGELRTVGMVAAAAAGGYAAFGGGLGGAASAAGGAGATAGAGAPTLDSVLASGIGVGGDAGVVGGGLAGVNASEAAAIAAGGGGGVGTLGGASGGVGGLGTAIPGGADLAPIASTPIADIGGASSLAGTVAGGSSGLLTQIGKILPTAGASLLAGAITAPKPADTSALSAAATSEASIAQQQMDLAKQQYADQKAITDQYSPLYQQMIQQQIDAANTSTARSQSQWDQYQKYFAPVEQQYATQAQNWASPAREQQQASLAGQAVQSQYDRARSQTTQALQQSGADPSTIAALEAAGSLDAAKAAAGASDASRRQVEQQGMDYLGQSANLGRNLPITGNATAGLAGTQQQQAAGNVTALSGLTAAPASTSNSLLSSAANTTASSGNLFNTVAQLNQQSNQQQSNAMLGALAGGLQLYGMYGSSKKTKHVGGSLAGKEASDAVEASPSMHWTYKPDAGDDKRRVGPMAEDLHDVAPEASDGKRIDAISLAGLHHAAIGDHAKRLKRLERKASLAGRS
jgi:hypothetical protein